MCEECTPRLRTKDLARLAAERLAQLRAEGEELHPVVGTTRKLASNFWGRAWMRQLSLCEAGGLNLAPGRSLLRHGCVLDLRISPGRILARVSGEDIFETELLIRPPDEEYMEELQTICRGKISSLVALLEGKVDSSVLEVLCTAEGGLLPRPEDWSMRCTCTDWSEPCAHAAAAFYAAGILIDQDPMYLFTLRMIPPEYLLQIRAPIVGNGAFDNAFISDVFGIDVDLMSDGK